jgi:hypothetical protein
LNLFPGSFATLNYAIPKKKKLVSEITFQLGEKFCKKSKNIDWMNISCPKHKLQFYQKAQNVCIEMAESLETLISYLFSQSR